jgi:hypothetical protein
VSALRETIVGDAAATDGLYLPHRQLVGVLKRLHGRALPDPGKESFAPGAHIEALLSA